MTEPEDRCTPGDLADLEDARDRALTLAALEGVASWPLSSILPLRRAAAGPMGQVAIETAYVRHGAPLVVLSNESVVRERRYVSAEDVVNDGWRAD